MLQEQSPGGYVRDLETPEADHGRYGQANDVLTLLARLLKAREMIYELLANCVPSEVILRVLCRELMSRLDDDLKHELVRWAAYYEHRMQRGSKDIFHFEAFIAKFMTLYKKFLLDLYM